MATSRCYQMSKGMKERIKHFSKAAFKGPFKNIEATEKIEKQLGEIKTFCLSKNNNSDSSAIRDEVGGFTENDFIRLDNAIKIDKEYHEIKRLYFKVTAFVKLIATYLTNAVDNVEFTAAPAGSFPLNLKIIEPDEFDFVLTYSFQNMPVENSSSSIKECPKICQSLCQFISKLLSKCEITLIQKRKVVNIIIPWLCHCGKRDLISIDLAFLTDSGISVEQFINGSNLESKQFILERCMEKKQNMYVLYHPNSDLSDSESYLESDSDEYFDTNMFDEDIFDLCDQISPNIKLTLRILKFIWYQLFPKNYYYLRECKAYMKKNIFSSFILKHFVLKEVKSFPSSTDWEANKLRLRFLSISKNMYDVLETERDTDEDNVFATDYGLFGEEIIIKREPVTQLLIKHLIDWLENGCEKIDFDKKVGNFEIFDISGIFVKVKDASLVFAPYVSPHYGFCFKNIQECFVFKAVKGLPDTNISRWIYREFYEYVDKMVQLDLTCSTDSNERKNLIVLAIHTRLINKKDIEHCQTQISNLEKKLKKSDLNILQNMRTILGGFGEYPFCRCFGCDDARDNFNNYLHEHGIVLSRGNN